MEMMTWLELHSVPVTNLLHSGPSFYSPLSTPQSLPSSALSGNRTGRKESGHISSLIAMCQQQLDSPLFCC